LNEREVCSPRSTARLYTAAAAATSCKLVTQELDPALLAASKLVTDLTEQCAVIGDLHHAVAAGTMSRADVHAELGEIIAGLKPGRTSDEEIIVFDSSGTALQDVAAAAAVYSRAVERGEGTFFSFNA
jgi:alanine dehydrogenase